MKQGFSLAELLVAIVMSVAVTAVVLKIWQGGIEGFAENQKLRENASKMHTINLQIEQIIRNANETSCESGSLWLRPENTSSFVALRPASEILMSVNLKNLKQARVSCDSTGVLIETLFHSGHSREIPGIHFMLWK